MNGISISPRRRLFAFVGVLFISAVAGVRLIAHLFCLTTALILLSAKVSPSFQSTKAGNRPRELKMEPEEWRHSRGRAQSFPGLLPLRSRRTDPDNSINPFAAPPPPPFSSPQHVVSPEASALGESIMEEFVLFLTMKDAGLLDLCMQFKR